MRAWRLCLKTRPYSQFDGVRFAAIDGNSIVEEHGAPSACPIRSHIGRPLWWCTGVGDMGGSPPPSDKQETTRAFVDAGADLVLGGICMWGGHSATLSTALETLPLEDWDAFCREPFLF